MKQIELNSNVWDHLHTLKLELKYKKWSAVIRWLLDQSVSKGETMSDIQEPDHEKILQDVIGEETWYQIEELMSSRNLDLQAAMRYLISCYRLMSQEKTHQKLESKDVLEEVYDHIQQLGLPQQLDSPHPSREDDSVDISDDTSATEGEWLVCPLCWHAVPLLVKDPLLKPERGLVYTEIDGRIEHRFLGVTDKYEAVEFRRGNTIIVEQSMAIGTLRRLNQKLYAHILSKLESAYFLFGGRRL